MSPNALAISLRPDDVSVNVRDRIEAVVERTEVVAADIEQALGEGVYWLEFDCSDDDVELVPDEAYELSEEYSIDEYHEREVGGVSEELLNDDANDADGTVHSKHEGCGYFYGHVQLNESGDESQRTTCSTLCQAHGLKRCRQRKMTITPTSVWLMGSGYRLTNPGPVVMSNFLF